jgi:hypothetical protein
MNTLRNIGKLLTTSVLAGVFASAIMLGVNILRGATGIPPQGNAGFALVDNQWLLGVASGQNATYQSGITAHAGGTQAACLALPANIALFEVDTVASNGDSVCLPFAIAGNTGIQIANAGTQSLSIYGQAANNISVSPAVPDTINGTAGSSAYTLAANNNVDCFAAVNGKWKCVKGQ